MKEGVASTPRHQQIKNNSIEFSRVELVLPIVEEFFKAISDGQQRVGTHYTLKRFGDTRSVFANDGRGEVLKLIGQEVEMAALEEHDVMIMQQAWSRWQEILQLQEQKKPKKCSSLRNQGLEL